MTEVNNLGASIRARLLNKARAQNLYYNLVLTRFALERWLYRLSVSNYRDEFLLKGALLFDLWFDVPHAGIARDDRHFRKPATTACHTLPSTRYPSAP